MYSNLPTLLEISWAMPWSKMFVAGISHRKPILNSTSGNVVFVTQKVAHEPFKDEL
jgi:hypothetical protein